MRLLDDIPRLKQRSTNLVAIKPKFRKYIGQIIFQDGIIIHFLFVRFSLMIGPICLILTGPSKYLQKSMSLCAELSPQMT